MKYGLDVNNTRTLFPLGISAVERTPDGHVELVIGHSYGPKIGDTIAGRVALSLQEAAALADELETMIDPKTRDDD